MPFDTGDPTSYWHSALAYFDAWPRSFPNLNRVSRSSYNHGHEDSLNQGVSFPKSNQSLNIAVSDQKIIIFVMAMCCGRRWYWSTWRARKDLLGPWGTKEKWLFIYSFYSLVEVIWWSVACSSYTLVIWLWLCVCVCTHVCVVYFPFPQTGEREGGRQRERLTENLRGNMTEGEGITWSSPPLEDSVVYHPYTLSQRPLANMEGGRSQEEGSW